MRTQEGHPPILAPPPSILRGPFRAGKWPCLGWGPGLKLPPCGPQPKQYHRGQGSRVRPSVSWEGGGKFGKNSPMAPGTNQVHTTEPQSLELISQVRKLRPRELVQVTRGHRTNQWRGKTGAQESQSSSFSCHPQAKLPTLQQKGLYPLCFPADGDMTSGPSLGRNRTRLE